LLLDTEIYPWHCHPLARNRCDIRIVLEPLGHPNVPTPMIYTHLINKGEKRVRSPLGKVQWGRPLKE